jgi:hypothetical protein
MDQTMSTPDDDLQAGRLASLLLEAGLDGIGPLSGATELAREYRSDPRLPHEAARVEALIRRECVKNFTTGFITGLGGVVTFPVSIPAALGMSWLLQARLAGAIASLYGHDLEDARVRTKVLLSLAGDVAREAMRDLGLRLGDGPTQRMVEQIPGRALVEVNKRIGTRLIASAGQRIALRFPRAIPLFGGVVGGAVDALVCHKVGMTAQALFRPPAGGIVEGEVVAREDDRVAIGHRSGTRGR